MVVLIQESLDIGKSLWLFWFENMLEVGNPYGLFLLPKNPRFRKSLVVVLVSKSSIYKIPMVVHVSKSSIYKIPMVVII
jgi:hypothetical protein